MFPYNLNWRVVTDSYNPKYLVKGTVIATALYGKQSRFLIEEVRTRSVDGFSDVYYRVRDAACVTDDDIRAGKTSPIVARFDGLDDAVTFCENNC